MRRDVGHVLGVEAEGAKAAQLCASSVTLRLGRDQHERAGEGGDRFPVARVDGGEQPATIADGRVAGDQLHATVAAAGSVNAPRRVRLDQQCVVEGARLDVDRDDSLADRVEDGVAPVEQLVS
eukprot:scaffold4939_cov105-Phaeocystis_antarctica.AAC.1